VRITSRCQRDLPSWELRVCIPVRSAVQGGEFCLKRKFRYRGAQNSTLYSALLMGPWMLELQGHFQDSIAGTSPVKYYHKFVISIPPLFYNRRSNPFLPRSPFYLCHCPPPFTPSPALRFSPHSPWSTPAISPSPSSPTLAGPRAHRLSPFCPLLGPHSPLLLHPFLPPRHSKKREFNGLTKSAASLMTGRSLLS